MLAMMWKTAGTAIFNALIGIGKIAAAVFTQGVERTITEQTIKIF